MQTIILTYLGNFGSNWEKVKADDNYIINPSKPIHFKKLDKNKN